MWLFEEQALQAGFRSVAGVDEAGRGPLAGPVVSAAVILPSGFAVAGITDSKQLTPRKRDIFFDILMEQALAVSTGLATVEEIDKINILQASLLSMVRAVKGLDPGPDYLLIDGKFTIDSPLSQEAVIKGDARSISIAAASIIAKVTRDRIMKTLHEQYPQYGFDRHKGYPTAMHRAALLECGPSPVHRKTFRGVR
ncbi:ribonuclease HII [Desulfocicer niacini]